MSMSQTVDRPCPPRPVFESLPQAVRAALDWGNFDPRRLNLELWGRTYNRTPEQIHAEFERQKQARSLTPCPEVMDK